MDDGSHPRATHADIQALPRHIVGELLRGRLYTHPRPASRHLFGASQLGFHLRSKFGERLGGMGGWWFLGAYSRARARRPRACALVLGSLACGGTDRLPGGPVLATDSSILGMNGIWARLRELDETADPELRWSLRTPDATFAYRATAHDRLVGQAAP